MTTNRKVSPRLSGPATVVMTIVLLALLAAMALGSCAHAPGPPPSGPSCADVCTRAESMGCAWAAPTPMGATCAVVCMNAETAGVPWRTECLAKIAACDEACP